ncbi:MAG: response regulator [Thermoleophilia bacterium]|nr:response regulator [Thermoleophilia bacterium]
MIRTLVVDDDFMAVSVHRQFVERIPGFEVVGEATTAREAQAAVMQLAPELVLLDIYLPDANGIDLIRHLRAIRSPRVDVIAITSAKDVEVLRDAMQLGVVHYIVKPFTFATFRERLESYRAARQRLDQMQHAEQRDIDRLYGLLRTSGEASLPKGISPPTLTLVATLLRDSEAALSTAELAARAGLSQGVARRYLRFLADSGAVDYTLRYGAAGRPEHLYRWTPASTPS